MQAVQHVTPAQVACVLDRVLPPTPETPCLMKQVETCLGMNSYTSKADNWTWVELSGIVAAVAGLGVSYGIFLASGSLLALASLVSIAALTLFITYNYPEEKVNDDIARAAMERDILAIARKHAVGALCREFGIAEDAGVKESLLFHVKYWSDRSKDGSLDESARREARLRKEFLQHMATTSSCRHELSHFTASDGQGIVVEHPELDEAPEDEDAVLV